MNSPSGKQLLASTDVSRLVLFVVGTSIQLRSFYGAVNDHLCQVAPPPARTSVPSALAKHHPLPSCRLLSSTAKPLSRPSRALTYQHMTALCTWHMTVSVAQRAFS